VAERFFGWSAKTSVNLAGTQVPGEVMHNIDEITRKRCPRPTGYPSDNHMPAIAGATGNSTSSAGASTATTPSAVGHYAPLKAVTPMFTSSSRQSRSASPSASVSASPAGSAVSSPTVKAPSSKGFSAFGGTSTAGALAGVKDTHRSPRRLVRRSSSMNRRVGNESPSLMTVLTDNGTGASSTHTGSASSAKSDTPPIPQQTDPLPSTLNRHNSIPKYSASRSGKRILPR